MSQRAFVVVADACGVGALPDASDYGDDADANTLAHVADAVGGLNLPVLERLGLGCILPLRGVAPSPAPALHGRLAAQGFNDFPAGAVIYSLYDKSRQRMLILHDRKDNT